MILRRMTLDELATVLDWAADEGWNPGHDDAAAFLAADPEGFFVAEIDGALAAAISVINHSDSFAFLGLYLCHPEYRGRGIGMALWTHALAHAGERCVGLDGVPAQQANYRRSGFVPASETARFEGVLAPAPSSALRPATEADLPWMIMRSNTANGYSMAPFLAGWLRQTENRQTLVLDDKSGHAGFATWRSCQRGVKIGPLVAKDLVAARTLMHGIAVVAQGAPLVIDVPREMTTLAGYCRAEGMGCAFSTARMYRGPAPTAGAGIHTIATLELG
ncbi:GNAT family N-acetyltransferase [Tropicimonas sp. TH_r6]|uniref:GNAT family N-acetyltransferase n=1 Tax=Tropicimonas sp. TH_r6 TaxID=3082085 RepID=UPI002955C519|nr:GNAT family N-acetyltransferase [Tropicimonas sp. TH_r6]MDV7141775.1 GNAT family N-acetyltransferase [Tropicimonas sp. TH_r6]